MGWIPEPYELYGTAHDEVGVVLLDGEPIRTFIDGVEYSNKTSVYSRPGYFDGYFDVDTYGNYRSNRTVPGTPWIKEGGDEGDDIMYSWGDMSNNTQIGGASQPWKQGVVFKENHTWQTGLPPEAGDLTTAPDRLQPPSVKIFSITTNSTLPPYNDHLWLCNAGPYPVDASTLYIQKDIPGSYDGPIVQVPSGTIDPYQRYHIITGSRDYFVETGDAVKLVWKNNASDPQAPFGGRDIVIDRVEFNATVGGTLDWEPGNTIMNDETAPDVGRQINRSATCRDTNSRERDFFQDNEIIEYPRPLPPDPVCIEGLCNWDIGNPALDHVLRNMNFRINWTHHGWYDDPQVAATVYMRNSTATTWTGSTGPSQEMTYSGLPLLCGTDYWIGVITKASGPLFSYVTELRFRINCLPTAVNRVWPLNGQFTSAESGQRVSWSNSTDFDLGDTLDYTWWVDDTNPMTAPYVSNGTTMNNYSDPFQTNASTTYFWCLNVSDGWGAPVSNCANLWVFMTEGLPVPPTATLLKVDSHASGEGYLNRVPITNPVRDPVFSWLFLPMSRLQTGFHIEVRDTAGTLMWGLNTSGSGSTVEYNSDGSGTALSVGTCNYFRVKVRDYLTPQLWSDWSTPLDFCINTPPPVPDPLAPAENSTRLPGSAIIYWSVVNDTDTGTPDTVTYEYCIDSAAYPPYPTCNIAHVTVGANNSNAFITANGLIYLWEVRSYDSYEYSAWSAVWNFTTIVPPVAEAVGPGEALVGNMVTFYGNGSQGNISQYTWTIRDYQGAIVTRLTGAIVNYAFQDPGTYSVTLTVYDDSTGLSGSDAFYVLVKNVPKEGFDWLWLLILLAILFIIAPVGGTEIGRVALLTLLVAPMHGRRTKDKDEAETRGMIRGFILGNPGECYTSIRQNLGLKNGTLSWHLMKLEKEGIIKSRVQGTRRRYYSKGAAIPAENGGELREIEKRLLGAVEEDVGRSVKELAEELGVSSQLALYHIRRLSQKGFVDLERKGLRLHVYKTPENRNT